MRRFFALGLLSALLPALSLAESTTINVKTLLQQAVLSPSPKVESVISGSTFDVSFYVDTKGKSANSVELVVKFPPEKLQIVKPSSDKSLISVWVEPPRYSNELGTAHFVGVIPGGVVTSAGLITTITFKALAPGLATVTIGDTSKVLANDGLGTEVALGTERGSYTITPEPPAGLPIISDTHPVPFTWYNNPNPTFSWQNDGSYTDFSYVLDNKPFTVPDNTSQGPATTKSYEGIGDGIWYFHLKAKRAGVWGATTHYMVRIDTTPPAEFTPRLELLSAAVVERALVSFFTTDELSGVDHYEVGVIEKNRYPAESPAFVQAESPYLLSNFTSGDVYVVVRAFDHAGNVRDAVLATSLSGPVAAFLGRYGATLAMLVGALLFGMFLGYLGYRRLIRRAQAEALAILQARSTSAEALPPARVAPIAATPTVRLSVPPPEHSEPVWPRWED